MKKVILFSLILLVIMSFNMGSSTAYLQCKSESGRTIFNAQIQDIAGILEKAELIVDKAKISYSSEEGHIIFDPKNGVFTLYILDETDEEYSNHKYLQFWSIPSTFKTIKDEGGQQIYEFKAKIYGTEPRKDKEFHIPIITLDCRLEYSI